MELDEDTITELVHGPLTASPQASISTLPPLPLFSPQLHKRARSSSSEFPPPMRRTSTDVRPVPFSAKFQRVHPGTTGVTVLEHMERLDAVEASLERLARDGAPGEDEDADADAVEEDVAEGASVASTSAPVSTSAPRSVPRTPGGSPKIPTDAAAIVAGGSSVPLRAGVPELPPVPEVASSSSSFVEEEDLVALSKSTSQLEVSHSGGGGHGRWKSHGSGRAQVRTNLDWMQEEPAKKRTVICEVRRAAALSVVGC